jgi:hypothetical protein
MVIGSAEGVAGITAGATLAAATGLAFVTLRTTGRRIAAEHERQRRELAHERELADLADLRTLLDDAATCLDQAEAGRDGAERESRPIDSETSLPLRSERVKRARDFIAPAIPPLLAVTARLRVRLGPDDPITTALARAGDALQRTQHNMCMLDLTQEVGIGQMQSEVATSTTDFLQARDAFFVAAVERAALQ